eukprot:2201593-Pleurochrysis_carterae.AAC.1
MVGAALIEAILRLVDALRSARRAGASGHWWMLRRAHTHGARRAAGGARGVGSGEGRCAGRFEVSLVRSGVVIHSPRSVETPWTGRAGLREQRIAWSSVPVAARRGLRMATMRESEGSAARARERRCASAKAVAQPSPSASPLPSPSPSPVWPLACAVACATYQPLLLNSRDPSPPLATSP